VLGQAIGLASRRAHDRSVRAVIERFGELAGLDDDPLDPFGRTCSAIPSAPSWCASTG
jgi:hypothetical protein